MNKRTLYLKLQGDDSFYIVSDYATGGIILANSLDKKATMCPRFRRLDLAAICSSLALSFVLYSLGAAEIVPHEIGSLGFLIFAGTLAASLGCMLALNSVPIIRERRVGSPWIC